MSPMVVNRSTAWLLPALAAACLVAWWLAPPARVRASPAPPSVTYRVQPGDSLWVIAGRYGTTVEALAQANGIRNPDLIYAGDTLVIPVATAAAPALAPREAPSGTPTPGAGGAPGQGSAALSPAPGGPATGGTTAPSQSRPAAPPGPPVAPHPAGAAAPAMAQPAAATPSAAPLDGAAPGAPGAGTSPGPAAPYPAPAPGGTPDPGVPVQDGPRPAQAEGATIPVEVFAAAHAGAHPAGGAVPEPGAAAPPGDNAPAGSPPLPPGQPAEGEPLIAAPQPLGRRWLALTFNGLPDTDGALAQLLEVLAAHGATATFFVTGQEAAARPAALQAIAARGHEVGVQGYSGQDLSGATAPFVQAEILRARHALEAAGLPAPRYLRPPEGRLGPALVRTARGMGMRVVLWSSVGLRDRAEVPPDRLVEQARRAAFPGAILLLHAGRPGTAAALPQILSALVEDGYRPVRISDLLWG